MASTPTPEQHLGFDPIWIPVLTHYASGMPVRLDFERTADHLRHITPHVRQYLIAGTTGDGWGMSDGVLDDWITLAGRSDVLDKNHCVLFGAFGATTAGVIERAQRIETAIEAEPLSATYAGLTLCAPVAPDATQADITEHFRRIVEATSSPLAIYQLPQVVGCEIAPETFAEIAASTPRVFKFKDTSGEDRVACSNQTPGSVHLLRGAEGDYSAHLKPNGSYDGWLLSTGNGFARQLRTIADLVAAGAQDEAAAASDELTNLVDALLRAADDLPSGNPFSNANRAVDHLFAYGADWRKFPARLASGDLLPEAFLANCNDLLTDASLVALQGYRKA